MPSDLNESPKIESSDLNLDTLFKDFYCVPDYQREYVWEEEDVSQLLQDIYDEFYEADGHPISGPEYFIGSVVACRDDNGVFQLIDGQQRLTTIYLVLCAIRDHLKDLNAPIGEVLAGYIRSVAMDAQGNETSRFRLVLQYEDSRDVLEKIAGGLTPVEEIEEETISIEHLKVAYQTIRTFLRERFEDEPAAVKLFFGAFMKRVTLIRMVTPRLAPALLVFETINDRGVGLNAVDLLKNLLFIRVREDEHPKLKNLWKDFITRLEKVREKPLRFLRYFVMAEYRGDWSKPLRAEHIYDWFRKNTNTCGIDSDPIGFVKLLRKRAGYYENFLRGKDPHGSPDHHLQNIAIVAGRAARQHMILLMAATHLSTQQFNRLTRAIENLICCFVVTKESTKTLERWFGQWASDLRAVETDADLELFLQKHINAEIAARHKAFEFALSELTLGRLQKYKVKYLLAKLTQHIERVAWNNPVHDSLDLYVGQKVEIEHILPQRPKGTERAAFDKPEEYDSYKQRLGNLTLLEKVINIVNSNRPFDEKVKGYKESALLLTKSLHEKPSLGNNSSLNRAVELLPEFDGWDSAAIERRQEALVEIARRVWLADVVTA